MRSKAARCLHVTDGHSGTAVGSPPELKRRTGLAAAFGRHSTEGRLPALRPALLSSPHSQVCLVSTAWHRWQSLSWGELCIRPATCQLSQHPSCMPWLLRLVLGALGQLHDHLTRCAACLTWQRLAADAQHTGSSIQRTLNVQELLSDLRKRILEFNACTSYTGLPHGLRLEDGLIAALLSLLPLPLPASVAISPTASEAVALVAVVQALQRLASSPSGAHTITSTPGAMPSNTVK